MHRVQPLKSRYREEGCRWAIVLSGGDGESMRPVVEDWLGYHCPKQYCTFVGSRSLLQHTLDRARQIVHPEHIVTVIGRGHRNFLEGSLGHMEIPGRVIEQPANRDTLPGVLLAATYIMTMDPQAIVLIFPSDHFVFPERRFLVHVVRAGLLAHCLEDRLVLLGAQPDRPAPEYGWIEPGAQKKAWAWSSRESAREIISFREKSLLPEAEDFFSLGYLWNTMITAVQVKTLWSLG